MIPLYQTNIGKYYYIDSHLINGSNGKEVKLIKKVKHLINFCTVEIYDNLNDLNNYRLTNLLYNKVFVYEEEVEGDFLREIIINKVLTED